MIEICWQDMSLRSGRDPRRPVRTTLYRRCRIFSDHIGREQIRRRLLSALTSHQAMMPLEMIQYMSAGPRRLANSLTEPKGKPWRAANSAIFRLCGHSANRCRSITPLRNVGRRFELLSPVPSFDGWSRFMGGTRHEALPVQTGQNGRRAADSGR